MSFLLEAQRARMAPAAVASLGAHVALAVVLFFIVRHAPIQQPAMAMAPDTTGANIVWLREQGPGGGGGGGGNRMKDPPRQAQLRGQDTVTVPAQKPQALAMSQQFRDEPDAIAQPDIPVKRLASATDSLTGVIAALAGPQTLSQGPGSLDGAGPGDGHGIGPGRGDGLDDGYGRNIGGGPPRPGNGVTTPQVIREVKPAYTPDAMRAKVQGTVLVECLVNADGSVGDVQVRHSLDAAFGLDQEAVKAARQWRFRPGTKLGQPVPVLITIELTFTLR